MKKKIIECNTSIAKMQETHLELYKSQLENMCMVKDQLYVEKHQQQALLKEQAENLNKIQAKNVNMWSENDELNECSVSPKCTWKIVNKCSKWCLTPNLPKPVQPL